MNETALEVLEQYDFEVKRTWKGRGVYFHRHGLRRRCQYVLVPAGWRYIGSSSAFDMDKTDEQSSAQPYFGSV